YAHRAYYLPPIGGNDARGCLLQLCAESVVGGKEKPGLAALAQDRRRRADAERRCVVDVVDRVGSAILARQGGTRGADGEERNFLFLGDRRHGEADAGIGA